MKFGKPSIISTPARRGKRTFAGVLIVFLTSSSSVIAQEHCTTGNEEQSGYQRIVSIGGAITETIYALGQGHRIVATDTTSYYPEEAKATLKVGYQRALSAEGILSAKPDLVIASEQAGPSKVIKQIKASGQLFRTLPTADSIEDVLENTLTLGALLCVDQAGRELVTNIESNRLKLPSTQDKPKQRVLFILQHGGGAPMVAGSETSAASIIALSGAQNAIDQFDGYKPLTPEALLVAKPDFILTTKLGFKQAGGPEAILNLPGIALTPAGKEKAIIAMDSLLLLGFGPRTIEAANQLYQKLHSTL